MTISIDKFKLFGTNGKELYFGKRRGIGKGWDSNMTDEQNFSKSIRADEWCTVRLKEAWKNIPFKRCSGAMRRDHKFIAVRTVRLKRMLYDAGCEVTVKVSIII